MSLDKCNDMMLVVFRKMNKRDSKVIGRIWNYITIYNESFSDFEPIYRRKYKSQFVDKFIYYQLGATVLD
jgi:hypothetical protein